MATPPLLLGPKFKVLSLVGLSGSGIIGSFSAIHKSADRASETIDPAKAAIRQGLGYMFSGTSQLGFQADEWLSYLIDARFRVLHFLGKNGPLIAAGQKSMVDQGQDWVKEAKKAVVDYFQPWLDMLPYLFYYFNRTRNTLFGQGMSDVDFQQEMIQKILGGQSDMANEMANLLMGDDEFKKTLDDITKLAKNYQDSFSELTGDNKGKIEKARDDALSSFTSTISSAINDILSASEDEQQSKLTETLQKIARASKEAGKKFQEDSSLKDNDEAKKAQKATTDLLDWLISDLFLPMFTNMCDEGDSECASVTVEDTSDDVDEQE